MKKYSFAFLLGLVVLGCSLARAQVNLSGVGTYTQDFNALHTGGANLSNVPWTDNATLPGWFIQPQSSTLNLQVFAGTGNTVGVYSLGTGTASTDRAVGAQPGTATGAVAFGVLLRNNSAEPMTLGTLTYTGEQYRFSGAANNTHTMWYQISASPIFSLTPASNTAWTALPALNFTNPVTTSNFVSLGLTNPAAGLNPNLNPAYRAVCSANVAAITLAPGEYIMFRLLDADNSGTDHTLGMDDFSLSYSVLSEQAAPTFTQQPADVTATVGAAVTLTVSTSGAPPPVFQWRKDGVAIPGATGSTLAIPQVQFSDQGSYDVVATNSLGSVTSNPATLVVTPALPPVTAPTFSLPGGTYTGTQSVSISSATADATIRYTINGADPTSSSGAIYSGPVSLTGTSVLRAIAYKDAMLDSGVTAASYTINTDIWPAKPGPGNTGVPAGVTLVPYLGQNTITVDGTVIDGKDITGMITIAANNVTIRRSRLTGGDYNIQAMQDGPYTGLVIEDCELRGAGTGIYGRNFTATRLNIHDQTGDGIKPKGGVTVTHSWFHHLGQGDDAHADGVQAREGGANMLFRYNNFDMPAGAALPPGYKSNSNFILEIESVALPNFVIDRNWLNGGNYTIYVDVPGVSITNNRFGRDTKGTPELHLLNGAPDVWSGNIWDDTGLPVDSSTPFMPMITAHPASLTVNETESATFTVAASGLPAPTFQWRKDGVILSGATSASLVLASTQASDAGSYDVVVTNSQGSVTSVAATLTVVPPSVVATPLFSPAGGSYATPQSVILSSTTSGSAIHYTTDGSEPVASVSPLYSGPITIAVTTTLKAVAYRTGVTPSATATAVYTIASALSAPTITQQPVDATVSAGAGATFTVAATGNPEPTYQWRKGGVGIGGATSAALTLTNAQAADAGSYDVVVSNSQGSVTSNAATLMVLPVASGTTYYVDPAGGSMSNPGTAAAPWSTLEAVMAAGKVFAAGDTIYLRTGDHGFPVITGNNSGAVTITKEAGHDPVINRLDFNGATHWVLDGVKVHTTATPPSPPILVHPVVAQYPNTLLRVTNTSSDITIRNCTLYSIADPSAWTADDWNNRAWNGIYLQGVNHHVTIEGCTVRNVNFGIHMNNTSHHVTIRNNVVQNFCGDGVRANCDDLLIENNVIGDAIGSNPGQHYDLIQGFASARVTIRGNRLYDATSIRPFHRTAQGIGAFDGMFVDWVIENNVIAVGHLNGITLLGATNVRIVNNTVVKNPFIASDESPWIRIAAHKDGTLSTGNVVRNNLTSTLNNASGIGLVDFNVVSSNYAALFVDAAALDFHLKEGSEAVNAGSSDLAPAVDIEGSPRVVPYDVGAYERQGGLAATEAPVFQPAAGTYSSAQSVAISTSTPGAAIRYTTDGSIPTASTGTVYSAPIAVTSHTTIRAIAYHPGGGLVDSTVRTGSYLINSSTHATVTGTDGFYTTPLASAQSGSFSVQFEATPSVSPIDAVVGLALNPPTAYSGLATIVRFNAAGVIDAYNGSGYAAASSIPYTAGATYHFRLTVNVPAHTYSVFVTPPGGSEIPVGTNFAFRSSQAAVTSLQNWVVSVLAGSSGVMAVDNFTLVPASAAPTITQQPVDATVSAGTGVTFTVAATGSPAPAYQWRKGGINLGGATAATLTLASAQSADAGSYDVVVSNSAGSVTSSAATLTVIPAVPPAGTAYYVDPASGSMSNPGNAASPWSTLEAVIAAGKVFAAGDTIYLRSGNHGFPVITGDNSGTVTITKDAGHDPVINRIDFDGATHWVVDGVKIHTTATPPQTPVLVHPVPALYNNSLFRFTNSSSAIVVKNCTIYSIEDSSAWSADDWNARAWTGIYVDDESHHVTIEACTVKNVFFGIHMNATTHHLTIRNNIVQNFCGDGLRANCSDLLIEENFVADAMGTNGNHYDLIQGFASARVVIRDNFLLEATSNRPFLASAAGVGAFDGMFDDWVVENNVIAVGPENGITLLGARNCRVVNNTVVKNPFSTTSPTPWIRVGPHKDGTPPSSGNLVRNNLTASLNNAPGISVVDFNVVSTNYASLFVDYAALDLHLKEGSAAIDAGTSTLAPTVDIEGNTRLDPYDAGAYERQGGPPTTAAPVFQPAGGTYVGAQSVAISTATPGAAIRYTKDGSAPTATSGTIYAGPIAVTANTSLKAIAYHTGSGLADSAVRTADYRINSSTNATVISEDGFYSTPLASAQSGSFSVQFDATPSLAPMDAVVGLALGAPSAYSGLATLVRFNSTGAIDAYNGSGYAAAGSIPYAAGATYHFRLEVNVGAHTYSVFVTPPGGTEIVVGSNFAFRSAQASVAALDRWVLALLAGSAGSLSVNNFALDAALMAPVITTQPTSVAAAAGEAVTFSVGAGGNPAPTYQWRKGGVNLVGATSATLSFAEVQPADAGSYDVIVTNSVGSVTSSPAELTVSGVVAGPGIPLTASGTYTQNFNSLPTSGSVTWADNETLEGWYINKQGAGAPVLSAAPGGSGTTGLFNLATATASADRAIGALPGTNTGGAVAFGVLFRNNTEGIITLGTLGYTGEQYRYSGAANNTNTMWYQVSASPITSLTVTNDAGWTALPALNFTNPITTANAASLGLGSPASSLNANVAPFRTELSADVSQIVLAPGEYVMFRLLDVDNGGTDHTLAMDDFSLSYMVTVPPAITTQPTGASVLTGAPVTLTVEATGEPAPTFQWRKDGVAIEGATGSSLAFASVQAADAGSYDVVVSNSAGSVTSDAAVIAVTSPAIRISGAGAYAQNFNSLPTSGTLTWANNATLPGWYIEKQGAGAVTLNAAPGGSGTTGLFNLATASASADRALGALPGTNTGGAVAFGVQFYNDSGSPIVLGALGYTGEQYRYSGAANNTNTMWYQVSTSPISSLTVMNDTGWTALPALNFTNPITTANAAGLGLGSPASSLNANVAPFRTVLSANLGDIVLAPGEYIMFRLLDVDNGGTDHTLAMDDFSLAYEVFVSSPPVITTQPVSQTVASGSSVSLTVVASGTPAPTYQWRKDGSELSGATGTTLALAAAAITDAGSYDVVVSNSAGSVTSDAATLAVHKLPATITLSDLSQVYDGAPHAISVTTVPAGLPVVVGYAGSSIAPTNAGTYAVVAAVVDGNYEGDASATFVITKAPASITLGELSQTYDGTPRTVAVTTVPADLALSVTYDGSETVPTDAGQYAVVATVTDPNYAGGANDTLIVDPAEVTVTLDGLRQRYDGTPKAVAALTDPEDVAVTITYDGGALAPVYPGSHNVVATVDDPNYQGSATGEMVIVAAALVRRGATLNGDIDGSLQVLLPENVTLNGASIDGDLLVRGSPALTVNGQVLYAGVRDGVGAAAPSTHRITLNSGSVLRYLVRRVDAIALPVVAAPPMPSGTVDVILNNANQNVGNWATLRHLTLNSSAGLRVVPPGTYGNLTANGSSGFILGIAGATEPAIYNLQNLVINGGSARVQIVGPVRLTLANGVTLNGSMGAVDHPEWLTLRIASGGLTLNGSITFSGDLIAPNGTVTLNNGSRLTGTVAADRLNLNGTAILSQPAGE